ncbi:uncharacterized protein OCT59_000141 [Rhizophagus irregularis]|uniref:uncharacterized protein n=1 Tax=Rhizophagus irregularis TaxID=588596 RepID=UPI00331D62A3|nr:hypothetical protein OCT59_000141 [Rhizophagus irregularis]
MTCSKIFSGDLPELTYNIIQYLRKDISTLYSCILVNRLWCRLAIPLLWEDPFSLSTQNYHYINTYLCFLNEDGKAKFNEYGINDNLLLSNTLFNYPSFIKYLDTFKISNSVEDWVITLEYKYNHILGKLAYRSLLIENEVNSHSFEVVLDMNFYYNSYFDDTIDLILQYPNLTYNIRGLTLSHVTLSENTIPFLKFLSSNYNSISSIVFKFPLYKIDINDYSLVENYLSPIIISQNNLKKISFGSFVNLYNPFLTLKNFNCSNTLNTITFYFIDFKNIISILQEKFSGCLENLGFGCGKMGETIYYEQKQQLFEFIIKYYSSILLRNLGQALPSRLEYLCLALSFITSDLEIFLKNSQNTFIKKLLISNKFEYTPEEDERDENTKILFFIKKYIIKKERIKYLAIVESDSNASTAPVELFFLKDEVNEYKLHNIIVQKYEDLYIDTFSYINNHTQC